MALRAQRIAASSVALDVLRSSSVLNAFFRSADQVPGCLHANGIRSNAIALQRAALSLATRPAAPARCSITPSKAKSGWPNTGHSIHPPSLREVNPMQDRIATKSYGTVSADRQKAMSVLAFVQGLADGSLPLNTSAQTLPRRLLGPQRPRRSVQPEAAVLVRAAALAECRQLRCTLQNSAKGPCTCPWMSDRNAVGWKICPSGM